ncbi:uncharacterized protein LOC127137858 [Lathyrus oleraceus]|uniref:uncharacterized protein LOC127137858 n=1 Tax=Pisum sativum TaxID=3888 RepID=UPI0021D2ADEE|nr:uncharacterized protein LOC127137858 [Pisum sativum]
MIIEKVLRYINPQFDYIIVAIEHSKDLSTMRFEELQSSLEAQELRLTKRNSEMEFGHSAIDCWSNKERKLDEANIVRGDSDDEHVLLMASESDSASLKDWWYMDTSCSNHPTGNKKWLVEFDSGKKTKIRCVDDKYLNAEGIGNVKVVLNNGKTALIQNV